ncbi:hypothetical protein SLNSH_06735 [Alsobacter soli]|uniref:Blue-light-activated histidine kinase n=1 Tax=Alsobacter soli TaxID=2109933 RepID=A0A2T1HVH8_9HYPH|nr:PAS domain S-box protein [Alsobacter soli]PSC05672.1 hypothetical protein SLNSH_06735 [Alsobacter soli]
MPSSEQLFRRQKILADFGEFALRCESLDAILDKACLQVAEALGAKRSKILEIQGDSCLLRAGRGWDEGLIGALRLPMKELSSESFAIKAGKPVITQDIHKEDRFQVPDFMKKAGIVALANAPIFLPGGKAYGLIEVDDTQARDFSEADTEFLRTYAIVLGPVIDRLQISTSLRSTEEQFRLIVESARDYAIFTTDQQDRIRDWYPGAQAVFGWTADEAAGEPAAILFTEEDRAQNEDKKEASTAARDGAAPDVRWHVRKDGSLVFIHGSVRALRDEAGVLLGFLKIGQDLTDQKRAQQRMQVLINELQHRGRNLLGVIAAIAKRTIGQGGPLDAFEDRLTALSRAQGLLSRSVMDPVPLSDIIRTELAAHVDLGSPKLSISGPSVRLKAAQVQNFALALHELATNAMKHGALREEAGLLFISWKTKGRGESRHLVLNWTETGVTLPQDAQSHRGYGRELIERGLGYAVGARSKFELGSDGVRCEIEMPLGDDRDQREQGPD